MLPIDIRLVLDEVFVHAGPDVTEEAGHAARPSPSRAPVAHLADEPSRRVPSRVSGDPEHGKEANKCAERDGAEVSPGSDDAADQRHRQGEELQDRQPPVLERGLEQQEDQDQRADPVLQQLLLRCGPLGRLTQDDDSVAARQMNLREGCVHARYNRPKRMPADIRVDLVLLDKIGHLLVAQAAREELGLSRLFLIPAAQSPFKPDRQPSPAPERLRLLRLALVGQEWCEIDEQELKRGGVSYTIDTLRDYSRRFPQAELFYLIGADHVSQLPKWRQAEELAGFPVGISSSQLRARVKAGLSIAHLVPASVAEAVRNNRLYL